MLAMEQPLLVQPLPLQPKTAITTLYYRPLQPDDFAAVKAAHAALFPIDYDDGFFHKATNGIDRIWSCAAFAIGSYGEEQLAGFITAKKVHLYECDTTDRQHMQLLSPVLDHDHALYILTLGVLEAYRHQGVASHLINSVCQHAYDSRCRVVFLHVITYNTAAMALYMRAGFQCMARLSNFYHIATGRQPDPATVVYDAFLYVQFMGAPGGLVSPWDMITIAWTPLRSAMGRIRSCMPRLRRQRPLSSTATCGDLPGSTAGDPNHNSSSGSVNSYQMPEIHPTAQQDNPAQSQHQQHQQQHQHHHHQQQQQQQASPYSRYKLRSRLQHLDPQLSHQQQAASLLPPTVQHHQHSRLRHYQQQRHQQLHYQQQEARQPHHQQQKASPHRRMLRWLFNAHSRSPSTAAVPAGHEAVRQQQLSLQHRSTGLQSIPQEELPQELQKV